MNLNEFAKVITLREGKKKSLSIAQVKEVLRLVLEELKELSLVGWVKFYFQVKRK